MDKCIYAIDDFGIRFCGLESMPVSKKYCEECKQREDELMNNIHKMFKEIKRRNQ